MSPSPRLGTALLALLTLGLVLGVPAGAQDGRGPTGYAGPCPFEACAPAVNGTLGGVGFGVSVRLDAADPTAQVVLRPGAEGNVLFAFTREAEGNATANVSIALDPETAGLLWLGDTSRAFTLANASLDGHEEPFTFRIPADATSGFVRVPFTLVVNGETLVDVLTVEVVPAPAPPPAGPNVYLWGGAAAVLVLAGGAYAVAKRRRPKPAPRSATLQRMALEEQAQRARTEEERQEIQKVIVEQDAAKAEARDLQILRAKRADAEKMLGLLEKRLEGGAITKLQFEKMAEKKRADLARIDEEIASFSDG